MKAREVPIERNEETGDIQISFSRSWLNKKLTVNNGNVTYPVYQRSSSTTSHKDSKEDDNEMETAVGVVECHKLLTKAQKTLFEADIFKHLQREAQTCQNSMLQVFDDEIKIYIDADDILTFRFGEQKQDYAKECSRDQMEIESVDISMEVDENRTACALVYISLQELLRKKHQKNESEDHRIKLTRDFIDADRKKAEKEEGEILNSVLLIYRHFKLRQQIARKMELLCSNNPPLIWHWLNTKSSTMSVFELKYAKRNLAEIRILGTEILLPQTRPLKTVDELVEHLLQSIANFYLESISSELKLLLGRDVIHRKLAKLWFSIRDKSFCIEALPSFVDYKVHLTLFEIKSHQLSNAKVPLDWHSTVGAMPTKKNCQLCFLVITICFRKING